MIVIRAADRALTLVTVGFIRVFAGRAAARDAYDVLTKDGH